MNFFIGLLIIFGGIAIMHFRYKIYDITGEWSWAEQYIGGTLNAIILIGCFAVGFGVAYMFGAIDTSPSTDTPHILGNQVSP